MGQSSRDPCNSNVEATVYASQHQEEGNIAGSESNSCSSDDVTDHTKGERNDQVAVSLLTAITADGDTHSAESSKDVWRSDEKQRVDLVVAKGLDKGGDEGGNSCGAGLGDDDASKKPDFVVGDGHPKAREERASLSVIVAVTVAKSKGGNALLFL